MRITDVSDEGANDEGVEGKSSYDNDLLDHNMLIQ